MALVVSLGPRSSTGPPSSPGRRNPGRTASVHPPTTPGRTASVSHPGPGRTSPGRGTGATPPSAPFSAFNTSGVAATVLQLADSDYTRTHQGPRLRLTASEHDHEGYDVASIWSYAAARPPRTYGVEVTYDFGGK